jgi:PAS domain S-box-containing protein
MWVLIVGLVFINTIAFLLLYQCNLKRKSQENIFRDTENELITLNRDLENQISDLIKQLEIREQLARVTVQTQNAVMLMNNKGDIIWVNNSFSRLYEYTYEEFINKLGRNIRQTSFNPLIHERLNRCINEKTSVTYEALNITKTGKKIWTHTSLVPLLDDKDEVAGLVTIDSDIHNRIKAGEDMAGFICSFNEKMSNLTCQLDFMVDLTNDLFERIEISQRRMNRTEQILAFNREISDKIKILGINASIEAYAAGTKGNGFRVIANEVVAISNTMLDSLKEINELVLSVKRSSEKLGNEKERSGQAIQNHRNLINLLKSEISDVEVLVRQMS